MFKVGLGALYLWVSSTLTGCVRATDGIKPPWWWDSVSNFVGVLIGAIISAVIAYLIARQGSREILKRDETSRTEQNKSAIFRMSVELVGILDVLGTLREDLLGQLEKRKRPEFQDAEPWQVVMPVVGYTTADVPRFNEAALAILFEGGHLDLMQKMNLLHKRCLAAHTIFMAYNDRREALNERLPPPEAWEGNLGRTMLTDEEFRSLQRYAMPLNDLLTSLAASLETDWALAKAVAAEFTVIGRKYLDRPNFEVTTAEEIAAREAAASNVEKAAI